MQVITDAVSASPSVIVIEKLDFIREGITEHLMEHLQEKLQEIKPCNNVLVIGKLSPGVFNSCLSGK